jgi:cyclase
MDELGLRQVSLHAWAITTMRGCNPAVVATSDGVVVVDTPQLPTRAVQLRRRAESLGDIRYIINTEHHVDHIFGNYYFRGSGAVVHHQGVHDNYMETTPSLDSFDYAASAVAEDDPEGLALLPDRAAYFANPNDGDVVFDGDLTLSVGDTTFHLVHTPGHTPGQIAVHVPSEGVVFTGDSVFVGCQTWLMNSNVTQWLESLDRVRHLDFEILVPGHGQVADRTALDDQSSVLHEWVDTVAAAVARGWSRDEAIDQISFADRCPVDIGQEHMMQFVQRHNTGALWDKLSSGLAP